MGIYLAKPITNKNFLSGSEEKNKFTLCEMQGWRRQMEDAAICQISLEDGNSLYAVFDGHSGNQVSNYVQSIFRDILLQNQFYQKGEYETAFVKVFQKIDRILRTDEGEKNLNEIRKTFRNKNKRNQQQIGRIGDNVGCTANVVLVTPLVYVVANCGDSRSVLCRKGTAIQLSNDHKPQNASQYNRIYNAGGQIIRGRINGNLNLSRGFGDFRFKNSSLNFEQTIVTCMPQVKIFARSPDDEFIIMGCDGIFQRYPISSQPLVNFIKTQRKRKKRSVQILGKLFDLLIAKDPSEIIGCDNMTSILIQL